MNNDDLRIPSLFLGSPVTSGFTTRRGGVSPAPFDTLNFGTATGSDPSHVAQNYRILREYTGTDEHNVALMRQVHGTSVRVVTEGGVYPDTDGLVTDVSGLLLGVRVADCVPLLLYDPVRPAAGAVHCGWKPTVGGIAEHAVHLLTERFGCCPGDIRAAAGPSAGPCCYEIGRDVASKFREGSIQARGGSLYADIKAELSARLLDTGLAAHNMEMSPDCSICNPADYFSHRRDNVNAGRMMGFIMLNGRRKTDS